MFCAVFRRQSAAASPQTRFSIPPPHSCTESTTEKNAGLGNDDSNPIKEDYLNFTAQHRRQIVVTSSEKRVRLSPKQGGLRSMAKRSLSFSCDPTRTCHPRVSRRVSTGGTVDGCGEQAEVEHDTWLSDGDYSPVVELLGHTVRNTTSHVLSPPSISCCRVSDDRQPYAKAQHSTSRDSNTPDNTPSPKTWEKHLKQLQVMKKVCKTLRSVNTCSTVGSNSTCSILRTSLLSEVELSHSETLRDKQVICPNETSVTVTSTSEHPVCVASGSCDGGKTFGNPPQGSALDLGARDASACTTTDRNVFESQIQLFSDHSNMNVPLGVTKGESSVTSPCVSDSPSMEKISEGYSRVPVLLLFDSPVQGSKKEYPKAPACLNDHAMVERDTVGRIDPFRLNCFLKSTRISLSNSPEGLVEAPDSTKHVVSPAGRTASRPIAGQFKGNIFPSTSLQSTVLKKSSRPEAPFMNVSDRQQCKSNTRDTNKEEASEQCARPESQDSLEVVDMETGELPSTSLTFGGKNKENKTTERLESAVDRSTVGRSHDTINIGTPAETCTPLKANPCETESLQTNSESAVESTPCSEQEKILLIAERIKKHQESLKPKSSAGQCGLRGLDRKRPHETSPKLEDTASHEKSLKQENVSSSRGVAVTDSRWYRLTDKRSKSVATSAQTHGEILDSTLLLKSDTSCTTIDEPDPYGFDGGDCLSNVVTIQASIPSKSTLPASAVGRNVLCALGNDGPDKVQTPAATYNPDGKVSHKLTPNSYKAYLSHLNTLKDKKKVRKMDLDLSKQKTYLNHLNTLKSNKFVRKIDSDLSKQKT